MTLNADGRRLGGANVERRAAAISRPEHLAADAFTRTFVERVLDDADDLDVELGLRAQPAAEPPADRALVAEEVLRELAIDDRDLRVLDDVRRPEVAAVEQLDAHRLEVAGRKRVHERLHVLAVLGLVAFDRRGAVPLVAGQDRHAGMPGRLDPRRAAQAIEQLAVEIHRSRIVVSAERRRQPERDQVVHLRRRCRWSEDSAGCARTVPRRTAAGSSTPPARRRDPCAGRAIRRCRRCRRPCP